MFVSELYTAPIPVMTLCKGGNTLPLATLCLHICLLKGLRETFSQNSTWQPALKQCPVWAHSVLKLCSRILYPFGRLTLHSYAKSVLHWLLWAVD